MLRLGNLAVLTFAHSELLWRKVISSRKAAVTLFVSFHAEYETICNVEVHVIDINDQIPIFEKSDVSIFNTNTCEYFGCSNHFCQVFEHIFNVYRISVGN